MNKREAERAKKAMRAAVARFQKYVATYSDQAHYDEYSQKCYIEDMLYGIGISFCEFGADYTGPGGYERFKQRLREHLGGHNG